VRRNDEASDGDVCAAQDAASSVYNARFDAQSTDAAAFTMANEVREKPELRARL